MRNISFKASLNIDNNIYKELPSGAQSSKIQNVLGDYTAFLESPALKKATDGDSIIISRAKEKGYGFSLGMKFISDKLKEPFETVICTNKNSNNISSGELKYWTYMFLCAKKGEKPRMCESSFKMIERVLFNGQKVFKR